MFKSYVICAVPSCWAVDCSAMLVSDCAIDGMVNRTLGTSISMSAVCLDFVAPSEPTGGCQV
jgi:hypothetical protein